MNKNIDEKALKLQIVEKLKRIFDPEIPVNIYDLGLIYKIELNQVEQYSHCFIQMTLTSPTCPVADSLLADVKYYVEVLDDIDEVNVQLVFDPMWNFDMMSEEAKEIMKVTGTAI